MHPIALMVLAVAAIAVLLVLVITLRIPAFVALLIVAIGTALVAGIAPADVIPLIIDGMGSTLGSVALLVGLGAMLGGIVERTGGADVLAKHFTKKLGPKRVGPALMIAAGLVSIPIFFDVAFIILVPIFYSFSKAAGKKAPLAFGLPIAGLAMVIHATVPPHPGVVGSLTVTQGDAGLMTITGLLLAIPIGVLSHFVCKRLTARDYEMLPETRKNYDEFGAQLGTDAADGTDGTDGTGDTDGTGSGRQGSMATDRALRAPSTSTVIAAVLLPVLMISLGTIGSQFTEEGSTAEGILELVGAPAFALLTACVFAIFVLAVRNGWKIASIGAVMEASLGPAAVVVFVTGAGGVFAGVLTETGIGDAVSNSMIGLGVPPLLLAYLLAAALRIAQGSTTVAMLTAAGLLQSTILGGDFSSFEVVLLNLAMAAGAMIASHINDSGFWIVTRYLGLSVGDGLRTWTVLTTIISVAAMAAASVLWLFA